MKTKIIGLLMVLFVSISINGYTQDIQHWYLNGTTNTENLNPCMQSGDTLWLHKVSTAIPNFRWITPGGVMIWNKDSVAITIGNVGQWSFVWSGNSKFINVAFVTAPPVKPWHQTTSNSCGIWDAQPTPQTGTTYLWSMGGDTTQVKTITTPGTYPVMITNACGSVSDTIQILWSEPIPSLLVGGPFCLGVDTLQLDPNYTHQYSGYIWAGGATTRTITAAHSGTYSVTVTNAGGCKASSSTTLQFDTAVAIQMCYVTFDTNSWKNMIVWFVDPGQTKVNYVRIEVWQGSWITLATVPYTDGSFIDMGSSPQGTQYTYRVVAIGPCGDGIASNFHVSIWLTELNNELQWQNYVGATITEYVVFMITDTGTIIPIDTVYACLSAGCLNHSPLTPNPHAVKYFVAFQQNCNTNKSSGGWVKSNYWDPTTGTAEVPEKESLIIFPNPTSGQIHISGLEGNYQNNVYDFSGKLIKQTENIGNIDLSEFSSGIYTIQTITPTGVYTNKVIKK